MRHYHFTLALSRLVLGLGLVASCSPEAPRREVSIFGAAAALDEHVVWIDTANDEALLLDVSKKEIAPEVKSYSAPENPVILERRNGHNQLLLLARGNGSGDGVLSLLGPNKLEKTFSVGSRFDVLSQSDDGRYAFLRFSPDNNDADSLLFNPNEVAIVDLDADEDKAVTLRSVRGFGKVPRRVAFSPSMEVAGETRRLVVVLFESHVSLIDLSHLDRPEYTVELSQASGIGLEQVRFSPDEQKIYLAGSNSNDVFVLTLLPAASNRANDFEPSLNQLGAGARPLDMAIYEHDGVRRLLAVSGGVALIIESGSNRVTTIPLPRPANKVLLYTGPAPFDDAEEQRALLYSEGTDQLLFLDLDQVEERTTRNLERLPMSGALANLVALENNLVLLIRDNGLGMLDLNGRAASELSSSVNLTQAIPSPELNRLWIRPEGRPALAYLDYSADRSTPGQVSLESPIHQMLLFTQMKTPRVVLTHPSVSGSVTVLDAIEPSNTDKAVTVEGFFYANVFDDNP